MNFDFSKEYTRYSNVELLRIVLQPDKYQPQAVTAAKEMLATRTVTEEEQLQAQEVMIPKLQKMKVDTTDDDGWQKSEGIFGSAGIPDFTNQRTWWILTVILGLLIFDNIYSQISALLRHRFNPLDVCMNLILFVLQCAGFYFYRYKKQSGWILSAGWVCYMLLTKLFSFFVLINYIYKSIFFNIPRALYEVIAELILLTLSITLLCRPATRSAYTISKETMTRTIVVSTGITVLYCLIVAAWYYLIR